jgi:glycosyltransferase involved in cell wall biosynthesis
MYKGFALAVWRLAKRGDVVVVKTDPPLLSCAVAPVARARGLSQVNWLQDLYPEVALDLGVNALRPFARLLIAARDVSLRISADNVAIGEAMARRLLKSRIAPERISIIPNWCDDDAIRPAPTEGNSLRDAWGLRDKFVVAYSGNLGRAHEYDTLLGAAELLRSDPRIVFLFIGGGHLIDSLKREVKGRNLTSAFQFRPYQPASGLCQSLTLPDVHWVSLRPEMEGLIVPSKFIGIAAAGRPTIAVSAVAGEIGALVERYDCGQCVAPGDSIGLAAAIRDLRDDPERLRRLGENARDMLDNHMTRERALGMWETRLALAGQSRSVDLEKSQAVLNSSREVEHSTPAIS